MRRPPKTPEEYAEMISGEDKSVLRVRLAELQDMASTAALGDVERIASKMRVVKSRLSELGVRA